MGAGGDGTDFFATAAASIAAHPFALVRPGYDPAEVRAFLAAVADDVAALQSRHAALQSRHAELVSRHEELVSRLARSERQAAALDRRVGLDEPASAGAEEVAVGPDSGLSRADADESELQRRDAELDRLVEGMVRRLKRVLQDEHNDLLDQLRQVRGRPTAAVLSPPELSVERYTAAVGPFVEEAAAAGTRFVMSAPARSAGRGRPAVALGGSGRAGHDFAAVGGSGRAGHDFEAIVAAVTGPAVEGTVAAIVERLRRRLETVLAERGGDAPEVLANSLASVYRETRSRWIEPLSADVLSAAHAEAAWRAAPRGSVLRWVAEDADGPCSDCDDNALAGPVLRGEVFPTGQLYPPAHRGCRCLLVLVRP
jgi:DivIVA domain-containing protein